MARKIEIVFEDDFLKTGKEGSLVYLEIKQDGFKFVTNIDEGFKFLSWLESVKEDDAIKGILIIGNEYSFCEQAYYDFIVSISDRSIEGSETAEIFKFVHHKTRLRQINILHNIILNLMKLPKLVISAVAGSVVTPFASLVLGTDFRIGTHDTEFKFTHKNFGLFPAGGLPLFLSESVGTSKAQEIMFKNEPLNADYLFKLGILNSIIEGDFKDEAIKNSINLISDDHRVISGTKKLINHSRLNVLDDYFKFEMTL